MPFDSNAFLNNPWTQMGLGILGANQPGIGTAAAIGGGASAGLNNLMRLQLMKEDATLRKTKAEMLKEESARAKAQAQQDAEIRRVQNERLAQMYPELVGASEEEKKQFFQSRYDRPNSYQEWTLAGSPGTYNEWLSKRDAAKADRLQVDFGTKFVDELAKQHVEQYDKYSSISTRLATYDEAEKLLDQGMITGAGADWRLGFGKALQLMGYNEGADEIANTEAYVGSMAKETAEVIKNFGAGTGLSDADRDYAKKAAGGDINMTEKGLRRLIKINRYVMIEAAKQYNKKSSQIMERYGESLPYSIMVDLQEQPNERKPSDSGPKSYSHIWGGKR